MTGAHSSTHEELLDRVAAGELAPDDERVRELIASCATCRVGFAELGFVRTALDRYVEEERATLVEALSSTRPEDRELVARFLERIGADEPVAPRSRHVDRRRWAWGLLAAAAAVLLFVALYPWGDSRSNGNGPTPEFLGTSHERCLAPRDEALSFERFDWDWELGPGESFTLKIWNLDAEERPPIAVQGLKESEWEPGPEELEAMGTRIRYRVIKLGPGEVFLDEIDGYSRLRP